MWLPDGKYPGNREQTTSVTWRRRIDDQTELLACACSGNRPEFEWKKWFAEIRDEHGLV